MHTTPFKAAQSEQLWRTHYQWREDGHWHEPSIEATWERLALAVAGAEMHHHDEWRERFRGLLNDFCFLPGPQILANAGTSRRATLFDCGVMGPVEDSVSGIFSALREAMMTLQLGAGVGVDFSGLRPAGALAAATGGVASGPVSFLAAWSAATSVLASNVQYPVALRATLRCDHPDIESFIDAKVSHDALPHFRLSVLFSDEFMQAVADDALWPLVFPLGAHPVPQGGEVCIRVWSASVMPQPCLVYQRLPARALWAKLLAAELASGVPGVLFSDRINNANNLWYGEQLSAISERGDVPLPSYGVCNLGTLNLPRFVQHPLGAQPRLDMGKLRDAACLAVRFLDNVHDISLFALKAQEKAAWSSRRIGLGVTGLADLLAMLGVRYGAQASLDLTREVMSAVRDMAYRTSIAIAQEKGAFPEFDKIRYGASPFVLGLSHEIQQAIALHGIRNSHLLAVSPAESVSLLANAVSCGIGPVGGASVEDQLRMMEVVQSCVDTMVSMNVQVPQNVSLQEMGDVFQRAWTLGLKGCALAPKDRRQPPAA